MERRHQALRSPPSAPSEPPRASEDAGGSELQVVKEQLQRLFQKLPGHASLATAFALHCAGKLEPKLEYPMRDDPLGFAKIFQEERARFQGMRRANILRRRRTKRDFLRLNAGYTEEEDIYDAEEESFSNAWRNKSIAEDAWKAEYYQHLHHKVHEDIPESEPLASRTDRFADVLAASLRHHVKEQNRPVLTHEFADYENPYMMKKSALERILQECCVRNQLDERCMPRLLERQPDLVKLRRKAQLPPEVLEPLAAFRGDVRWSSVPSERLSQKLQGVEAGLEAVVGGGDAAAVAAALPENEPPKPDQLPGVHHPWRNHVGFESAAPRGVAGGTKFGQPMAALQAQVLKTRYPTLQRVAHTLPADAKWRAHVVRSLRVLERSKEWDYKSKLAAVNKLKEVYDQLKDSEVYTAALDEKLPVNRVPSHLKRKFAREKQYVKTYPKHFRGKKSWYLYRRSLTAVNPLASTRKP